MSEALKLANEFPEQNPKNFEWDAAVRLNKWGCQAAEMLRTQAAEIESLRAERDALKQQAQIHAMDARTANSTIYEIYQVVTGSTGEPGTWNGARPVREVFDALRDERDTLLADKARIDWLADVNQSIGNVQLPAECVTMHLDSLRGAIDAAMAMDKREVV